MMESSNLNLDLHHQEDFHSSSSSLAIPWNQDLILNNTYEIPMVQELGFQWGPTCTNGEGYLMNQEDYISRNAKGELGINLQDYSLIPNHARNELNRINGRIQPSFEPMDLVNHKGRGSFSVVLPSANVCSLNYLNGLYTSSLGMAQPSLNSMTNLLREDLAYNGTALGQLQEPAHAADSTSYHKVAHSSVSGVAEGKRGLDCKITNQPPPSKKPRLESRSSCTPFKVRKEKLGDRIAALQQLVAPFGKTDTASVLMEAIGYIKFLQDQVETLSVPYMNSSSAKKANSSQGGSSEEREEQKSDLRSRGLCLVPLSCMSYVTNENGGVWSPNNYR